MASNTLPWYLKLLGEDLIPARVMNRARCDPNDHLKIPTANLFIDKPEKCNFVVGLYYAPLETASDERLNQLSQLYQSINAREVDSPNSNSKDVRFEIVQVALGGYNWNREDRRLGVDKRFQDLPWYAIPPAEKHTLERLTRKFEIKTLSPALILLDGHSGELITKHGLEKIGTDPTGVNFPWHPQPLSQILENVDLVPGGKCDVNGTVSFSSFAGLIIGFYFSAHWCPPCRCFTPQLIDTYNCLIKRNVGFRIIFVSSDRSRDSFDLYLKSMPWLAVPYPLHDCRLELAALFGVQGIPTLVITDSDGSVITVDGRGEINDDPKGLKFPWRQKLANTLTDRYACRLQEKPAVVLFVEGNESEIRRAEKILTAAASFLRENSPDINLDYFIACDTEASDTLRDVVGIDDSETLLTIINIPEGTWCCQEETQPLSEHSVKSFVRRYHNNELNPVLRIGRR